MTKPLRLHAFELSGHAHRVELFLSLLGLAYEKVHVDLLKGAHKSPDFIALNPFGQVPVLEDGDVVLPDSNAILVYLALRYDEKAQWLPRDPVLAARVQRWLSVAAGELAAGPGAARRVNILGAKLDHEQAKRVAASLYDVMDGVLSSSTYLASAEPTLADVALYSYTAVASEGDVSLEPWPHVRAWLARIESLPGFVPMHRIRSVA
jgi:glutathione S-transferase